MGCIYWTGLPGQEHGHLTQGCRGAAEPRHQGPTLGTAHAGNTGQHVLNIAIYVALPASESRCYYYRVVKLDLVLVEHVLHLWCITVHVCR